MAKKPETLLVEKLIAYVKKELKGDCWHVHGSMMQRAGEPDLDGAFKTEKGNFVHFKVEAKMPGNVPSKLQTARLGTWSQLGYTCGVVWSLEEFITLLQFAATKADMALHLDLIPYPIYTDLYGRTGWYESGKVPEWKWLKMSPLDQDRRMWALHSYIERHDDDYDRAEVGG